MGEEITTPEESTPVYEGGTTEIPQDVPVAPEGGDEIDEDDTKGAAVSMR